MYKSFLINLLAATAITAVPAAIQKRDPSDQSGRATIAFQCSDTTIPNPGGATGEGEGGSGIFSTNLVFTDESGATHAPSGCTEVDGFCDNCLIEGGGLSSATNVTACSNPAGGSCSIEFQYDGYDFNSENSEPYCGHTNSFEAFGDDKTAICYFNVDGSTTA